MNVPARTYRIITDVTVHGGTIEAGTEIVEAPRGRNESTTYTATQSIEYDSVQLDRSVINRDQIRKVLMAYKKAIYIELYPERERKWEYIPKTLIFAKNDNHATEIVDMVKEVFQEKFESGKVPENFVQKITYSSGDSNGLIRDLRIEKDFRIAVTVTLVATGTDVKPLEVVLFMKDVQSDVLYTQMKGRGCRVISDDKLKEVTPNADTKECYYIVDAVGVTEHEKYVPHPITTSSGGKSTLSLEQLLEHLAHNEVSDEHLILLRDYCSTINRRYEDNALFGRHLDYFITTYGFAPRAVANNINNAFAEGVMAEYISPSYDNSMRMGLIYCLISNISARKKLLEMQKGYYAATEDEDEVIYAGFSKESA
ncbi:MAG: type I restriction endonuclease subunit R, partial [Lachnospiraceae bacterium]|nr:type I restriction endonuclease subunit R [Lachnospiraceae bacterium]